MVDKDQTDSSHLMPQAKLDSHDQEQLVRDLGNSLGAILGYTALLKKHVKDDQSATVYLNNIKQSARRALIYLEHSTPSSPSLEQVLTASIEPQSPSKSKTLSHSRFHSSFASYGSSESSEAQQATHQRVSESSIDDLPTAPRVPSISQILPSLRKIDVDPDRTAPGFDPDKTAPGFSRHPANEKAKSRRTSAFSEKFQEDTVQSNLISWKELEDSLESTQGQDSLELHLESEESMPGAGQGSSSSNSIPQYESRELKGSEQLLIVDDDPLFRKMLQTYLSQQGYHVISAEDGMEALEIFERERDTIDLVILDRYLPKKNGLLVAKQLRQSAPHLRVILLSGMKLRNENYEVRQLGISAVLQKPMPLRQLSQTLRHILDSPPPTAIKD